MKKINPLYKNSRTYLINNTLYIDFNATYTTKEHCNIIFSTMMSYFHYSESNILLQLKYNCLIDYDKIEDKYTTIVFVKNKSPIFTCITNNRSKNNVTKITNRYNILPSILHHSRYSETKMIANNKMYLFNDYTVFIKEKKYIYE